MKFKLKASLLVGVVALLPALASAQQIHKCKKPDGTMAYQETPCASEGQTQSVRAFERVPDAPRRYSAPVRSRPAAPDYGYQPRQPASSNAGGLIEGGGVIANQQRYLTRAEEAELRRQQRRATSDENGRSRVIRNGQPSIVTDQYGRRYQKPPGSTIVTDERTGRQCFLVGPTLQCP